VIEVFSQAFVLYDYSLLVPFALQIVVWAALPARFHFRWLNRRRIARLACAAVAKTTHEMIWRESRYRLPHRRSHHPLLPGPMAQILLLTIRRSRSAKLDSAGADCEKPLFSGPGLPFHFQPGASEADRPGAGINWNLWLGTLKNVAVDRPRMRSGRAAPKQPCTCWEPRGSKTPSH
jgi:hypothetical protein